MEKKKKDYVSEYKNYESPPVNDLLNKYLNLSSQEHTFNANTSKLYQDAAKRYKEAGATAMRDTMGQAAGLTGGFGSSYATTAGQQTYNDYMRGLSDVEAQIRAEDYGRHQDKLQNALSAVGVASDIDNMLYNRDFNERSFSYQQDRDALSQQNYLDEFGYRKEQDALSQQNYLDEFGYRKEQDELSQQNYLDEFGYRKQQDKQTQSNWNKSYEYNKTMDEYNKWINQQTPTEKRSEHFNTIYKKLDGELSALKAGGVVDEKAMDSAVNNAISYINKLVYGANPILSEDEAIELLMLLGIDLDKLAGVK